MCRECREEGDVGGASGYAEDTGCMPLLIVGLLVALSAITAGILARCLGGVPW